MDVHTTPAPTTPPRGTLASLVVIALFSIGLGGYQWYALYQMRVSGITPSCAISENIDCASVWNSPLADLAHHYTGLPFAGWGVAWGLIVLILTITLMLRRHSARHADDVVSALRITTAVGVTLSAVLLIYSLTISVFCPTCILFYVAVATTTYFVFLRLPATQTQWGSALLQSVGWLLVAYGVLLYPGLHTPHQERAGLALKPDPTTSAPADLSNDPLASFIRTLSPQAQQILGDARALYRGAPYIDIPVDNNRIIFGSPNAPVHLIDWIDIRCPHCRNLDEALQQIRDATPPNSWSEEAHHFPLDSECNRNVKRSDGSGVACLSAKLLICLAGSPKGNSVRTALFENQRGLTVDHVWQLAAPDPKQRAALEKCVASPDTATALQRDTQLAMQYGIEGTPLVVINGRQAPAFPPFIYAMIIAGGDSNAAGFQILPPPRPESLKK